METGFRSEDKGAGVRMVVVMAALAQIATPILPFLQIGAPIGTRSAAVETLLTPAGWAFSIWGALYAGSLAFAVYQAWPSQRHGALLERLRWPAAGAFTGNALWALYVQSFGLGAPSVAIIAVTLASLLTILTRLSAWERGFDTSERWLAVLPLSALAAWLTAATIVNIAASLRFHGVDAGDATAALVAGAVLIAGGVIVAAALLRSHGNIVFALVFLWALGAIYAKGGQEANLVAAAAFGAAVFVLLGAVVGSRRGGAAHWLARSPGDRRRG